MYFDFLENWRNYNNKIMNKINVLMVCTVELDRNGIAAFIMNYSEKLISEFIQIDIVAPNIVKSENIKDIASKNGILIYELPMRKENTLKYFLKLINIMRQRKYNIVHIHGNSCTMAIELTAAMLAGCRVRIAHSHNTTCQHQRMHKLLRPLFEITCTNRLACGQEAGKWLYKNKKFTVMKNGIDSRKYSFCKNIRTRIRRELGVKENQILLGNVGEFSYQKNQKFIINLMKELEKRNPGRYHAVLIGDGEELKEIKQEIQKYGMRDIITLTGVCDHVSDYLQAMDCFLLPSRYEGVPFVLIEAQASGLCCVVSDQVSNEADFTGNLQYLPIDQGEIVWVRQLETMNYERRNEEKIYDSDYELNIAVQRLEKYYREIVR